MLTVPSARFTSRLARLWRAHLLLAAVTVGVSCGHVQAADRQATPWTIGNGTMQFLGCSTTPEGVQCDLDYTLEEAPSGLLSLFADDLTYTTADGTVGEARSVSVAHGDFATSSKSDAVKGTPIRATFRLPLPTTTTSLRALEIVGHPLGPITISAPIASAPPTPNVGDRISGTVRAPSDLYGAVVFACVRQGDGCDNRSIHAIQVSDRGTTVPFSITGLDATQQYTVFAWLDTDGDGDITTGDLLGSYDAGSHGTPVSPPHQHTDFTVSPVR